MCGPQQCHSVFGPGQDSDIFLAT